MKTLFAILFCSLFLNSYAQNSGLFFNADEKNYIVVPSSPTLYPVNNFTIEFWMKTSRVFTDYLAIVNKAECVTNKFSFAVTLSASYQIYFTFNCNGNCNNSVIYTCNKVLDKGHCYHIAITYSSAAINVYIDGVLQTGSFTLGSGYCGDLYLSPEPMKIGVYRFRADTLGWYYDGLLDELRIWNHVRNQTQISTMMEQQLSGSETGLMFYYDLNDNIQGAGETVHNFATSSGSAYNGTTTSQTSSSPFTGNSCFNYSSIDESNSSDNHIDIYPNPATTNLNLNIEESASLEIINAQGKIVDTKILTQKTNTFDISKLSRGVYTLMIKTESGIVVRKMVKQ